MPISNTTITIIDSSGNSIVVSTGTAIPNSGVMVMGSDGTNSHFLSTDTTGHAIIVGDGTAGTPAGGVVSVQGVSGGTAIPVSGTVTATNPSTGTTGSTTPTSATLVGGTDGTNLVALKIKDASTAAVAADPSLVVAFSPNSPLPTGAAVIGAVTQSGTWTTTVTQATASNLNATVVGAGTAGTPSGGVVSIQGVSGGTVIPDNLSQIGGTAVVSGGTAGSLGVGGLGTAGTPSGGVVSVQGVSGGTTLPVSTADVSTTGALAALNGNVQVTMAGLASVGFQLETGTLIGTIIPEVSYDSGTTWDATDFLTLAGAVVPSFAFASSNTATAAGIVLPAGAGLARVRVSAYTSGTANATVRGAAHPASLELLLNSIATNTGASATDFTQTGTIVALNGNVVVYGQGVYTVSASITGTWSATLVAQGQLADLTWVTIPMYVVAGTLPYTAVFSTATNGTFLITGGSYLQIRIIATAFTSGTVDVALDGSLAQQTIFAGQLGAWSVGQGTAASLAGAWPTEITDGTHGPAAVKAASTAAATTDASLVVALSPNSPLYDNFGNPMGVKNRVQVPTTLGVLPVSGLDVGLMNRTMRVGELGTVRTTSETQIWHDALEGSTVNAFWTQSTTTQTIAQATGVLTLNNSGITTVNTDSIITSQRQFPKYPKVGLHARYKANISANVAANHTLVEFGFGAPAGVTAIISNGCFFRVTAAGNLVGVTSYNGTENVSATLLAQGSISTTSYYRFDIFVEDQFARFIATDANDIPVVDSQLQIPLTAPYMWAVSHLPTFSRVYVDTTGGGTAVKLNISGHDVQFMDVLTNKPWNVQQASQMRNAMINPTTYAQTASSMTAAPATETPSNTAGGYNTLGGDFATALTVASENPLSVFAFTIPSPYTFYLTMMQWSVPFVTTTIGVTGIPILEWLIIANCASGNISTGGGQRFPVGLNMTYTTATEAAGGFLTTEGNLIWNPDVPVACLPGTVLHIAYKVFITTAAATPGVTRGSVYVDGYFE